MDWQCMWVLGKKFTFNCSLILIMHELFATGHYTTTIYQSFYQKLGLLDLLLDMTVIRGCGVIELQIWLMHRLFTSCIPGIALVTGY